MFMVEHHVSQWHHRDAAAAAAEAVLPLLRTGSRPRPSSSPTQEQNGLQQRFETLQAIN
jgi:hypothetical protein